MWDSDEERRNSEETARHAQKSRSSGTSAPWRRGGGGGGGGGRGRGRRDDGPPPLELYGPAGIVGKIVGRGGSVINRMQQESGANIRVRDEGHRTSVAITGSPDAREKAREMVEPLLAEPERRPRSPPRREPEPPAQTWDTPDNGPPIDWEGLKADMKKWEEERALRLVPLIKDLYEEHPNTAAMTQAEVEAWRLANNKIWIKEIDDDSPENELRINPITEFEFGFGKYPEIMKRIREQGFERPSPIQGQAWPVLLSGKDMIGIAQTGTGKTLAFLLPALIHIEAQPSPMDQRSGPNVLVLAPTRELALQIEKEVNKYSYKNIKAVCIYGGASRKDQISKVADGVQIVIATPGRLNDLVDAKFIDMEAVTYLVLDEADRMLDMGFEPQIRRSLLDIRPDRQTVMTSATWPSQVRRLAASYMKNPVQVVVGSLDLAAVHTVTQHVIHMREEEKFDEIIHFLENIRSDEKAIVFCGKRDTAIWIATEIAMKGFNFQSIYGGLDQSDRERAVEEMQDGTVSILIATDIASRGLDIGDVTHVVNYDFPGHIEEYVHRIGRTGRAGKSGTAISYITDRDSGKAEELIKILQEADQEVPEVLFGMVDRHRIRQERRAAEGGRGRGRGGRGRDQGGYGRLPTEDRYFGGFDNGGGYGRRGGGRR